ncbi:hypothetical protein SLA2020_217340 [Shorea laevis]
MTKEINANSFWVNNQISDVNIVAANKQCTTSGDNKPSMAACIGRTPRIFHCSSYCTSHEAVRSSDEKIISCSVSVPSVNPQTVCPYHMRFNLGHKEDYRFPFLCPLLPNAMQVGFYLE